MDHLRSRLHYVLILVERAQVAAGQLQKIDVILDLVERHFLVQLATGRDKAHHDALAVLLVRAFQLHVVDRRIREGSVHKVEDLRLQIYLRAFDQSRELAKQLLHIIAVQERLVDGEAGLELNDLADQIQQRGQSLSLQRIDNLHAQLVQSLYHSQIQLFRAGVRFQHFS